MPLSGTLTSFTIAPSPRNDLAHSWRAASRSLASRRQGVVLWTFLSTIGSAQQLVLLRHGSQHGFRERTSVDKDNRYHAFSFMLVGLRIAHCPPRSSRLRTFPDGL